MRWELAPFGVDVILVEPGAIRTCFEATLARESGERLAREGSPYAPLYARVASANERIRASEPGPEVVAVVIRKALMARRPHARYTAAIPFAARIVMRLPDAAKDRAVRRLFDLGSLDQHDAAGRTVHEGAGRPVPASRVRQAPDPPRRGAPSAHQGPDHASDIDALLLTTHGRRSGKERTVVLQYFPDGDDLVLAAANDGGSSASRPVPQPQGRPGGARRDQGSHDGGPGRGTVGRRGGRLLASPPAQGAELRAVPASHRSDHPAGAARP